MLSPSMLITNLVFPIRGTSVCLGYKTTGFGAGKWNGFGGKVEPNESIRDAAVREFTEETGCVIHKDALHYVADLSFYQGGGAGTDIRMHVFTTALTNAEPREVEKLRPHWYSFADVPYDAMWVDDQYWLPRILAGERLSGVFWFDTAGQKILRHELSPL